MDTPNYCPRKHVVIVMDARKEFSDEPLEWVLDNITLKPRRFTMPNQSQKMGSWNMHLEDILATKKDSDHGEMMLSTNNFNNWQNYASNTRRSTSDHTVMGYPLNVTILEKIASLNATLAIFDRHHNKKNIEYYAKKAPRDILFLRDDEEEVNIIKGQPHVTNDDDEGVDDDMSDDDDDNDTRMTIFMMMTMTTI